MCARENITSFLTAVENRCCKSPHCEGIIFYGGMMYSPTWAHMSFISKGMALVGQ